MAKKGRSRARRYYRSVRRRMRNKAVSMSIAVPASIPIINAGQYAWNNKSDPNLLINSANILSRGYVGYDFGDKVFRPTDLWNTYFPVAIGVVVHKTLGKYVNPYMKKIPLMGKYVNV